MKRRRCPDCGLSGEFSKSNMRRHRLQTHGFVTCECGRQFCKEEHMAQHKRENRIHAGGLQHSSSALYRVGMQGLYGAFGGLSISTLSSDIYTLSSGTLESFIADNIQANTQFLGCCGEVIDSLVRKLQDTDMVPSKLRPRRIIKSGSLGKGTAVKDRSDIDLILMLVKYDNVEVLMRDMRDLLRSLEKHLKENTTAKHQRTTRYSVQVELTCRSGHKHDVDILPAVDLLEIGNVPSDVYRMMKGVADSIIHEYSVSLAPLQLDIIGELPTKVKSLIKLIKYWKDKKLKEQDEPEMPSFAEKRYGKPNWPSSYVLELVILNAWTEANAPVSFDMTRALHAILTSLVNHRQFKIILRRQIRYNMTLIQARSAPYIMDPANPFNDMYHGLVDGQAFDWDRVVPEARLWLSKPLFYGVSNTKHTWN
ncbi:2'-5'-oligoadenylate synthase 1A-like [Mercenaria mercenaria]|uniref:2'-5'-oligoadenylate synthase 1A-like n=1 Tax=Mercenaria mercenaria TaxID=6596 RepID=UPI00234ECB4A|nr:2'-5'-oligoadenylate synthase 1A-like [Mercenaria mercenaria]